jgi:transposase
MKPRRAEARRGFAHLPDDGRNEAAKFGGRVVNLKELMMILELHRQGLSVSAIAERTGHDRKTVRKYIRKGLVAPKYKPREPRVTVIDPYETYLRERVAAWPELSGARLRREIQELGYRGGKTRVNDFLREVRPPPAPVFELRFETPPGRQAQVDFAEFRVEFAAHPGVERKVWLFAMVLGNSRYLWAQYVLHQDLPTVLRCHMEAFEHFGGVPREILYDRMKTAVLGEPDPQQPIVYNAKLLACGMHYGFLPRACQAYRAKTKGKVERPYRYIRADFFMARRFTDIGDMNRQLQQWLDTVANIRRHGTTDRIVAEHFAEERPTLQGLPAGRFDAVLRAERRLSHDGCVSVGGNYYSVPDGTRARVLEVETTADQVRIHEAGKLIAVHALLQGRKQRSVLPGHRHVQRGRHRDKPGIRLLAGHAVATRSLGVYEQVARHLGAAR